MRKYALGIFIILFLQINLFNFPNAAFAQKTGSIYKSANNGGNKVLDPNGDGFVSKSTDGFPGENRDEGAFYSEIPYRPFPVFEYEPLDDLSTGPKGGDTDFAPKVYEIINGVKTPVGSPLASYFDGTNILFRVRLGNGGPNDKRNVGYSILIDANGKFESTGTNPGFEYEIVLYNEKKIYVYYHGENTNKIPAVNASGPSIFEGSAEQYSQKSTASSKGGGDEDHFYDFYIPISEFDGAIPITSTTPLRMAGITVTSANTGDSGLFGTISDIGGVDDTKYKNNQTQALKDIIGSYPPASAEFSVVPFPVELMYLKIAVENKQVVLKWETASEKDNEKFEIQRSADGKTFYTIGMVRGNGTSSRAIKYNYIDTEPLSGTAYYRLKQIDFGGETSFSRLVSVKLSSFAEGLLHTAEAYPNPFTSELKVVAYAANPGTAKLVVMDMQGRMVYSSNFIMNAGENNYMLELPECSRGVYILKVFGNSIYSTTKLVKAE